ncbi:hypothetical protein THII_2399 [Thioploca ingrica]|uniref:non-specific serine/threonine protein kinase n=1 Tax=Thioploca ingrica TaxID=40754 RepID=A0A090BVE1_9GAMM|nr:hypothetical protein THII_2399 [Thioploca ingrica]
MIILVFILLILICLNLFKTPAKILTLFFFLIMSIKASATVLSAGDWHNCAIQADNTIVCWGSNGWGQAIPPPGLFSQVSAGYTRSCGIRMDKTVTCWGLNAKRSTFDGLFSQMSVGGGQDCGIKTDGSISCSSTDDEIPTGRFSQISAGFSHVCAITQADKTIKCWGVDKKGKGSTSPPPGTFLQLDAGEDHSCAIKPDGSSVWWGWNPDVRGSPPLDNTYKQISVASYFSCALQRDNTVVCFGPQDLAQSEGIRLPKSTCRCPYPNDLNQKGAVCACSTKDTFARVEVGHSHACAIQPDNNVICWGYDREGQAMAPMGLRVKSSNSESCLVYGIHDDTKSTQTFIVNISPGAEINIHPRSRLDKSYHLESLDVSPLNNRLYAASEEGFLYEIRNGAQVLSEIGETGFNQVKALSFHPDGTLWGWSQGSGLFKIDKTDEGGLNLATTEEVLPYSGSIKIEDISWNTSGTILYGIENEKQNSRLWAYFKNDNSVRPICEELISSLNAQVSALETSPNDDLILGFKADKDLAFSIIKIQAEGQTCQLLQSGKITTEYNDIKGIAWPNCHH